MTALVMNAGQKINLSVSAVDGAGVVVSTLPTGSKVTYSANNPNYLLVTANADGVTAVAEALTPPAQGTAVSITASLTFTDAAGLSHTETSTLPIVINFAPGVPATITVVASTPA